MCRFVRHLFFTILIKAEGAHDAVFLALLKEYYVNCTVRVKIKKGHGGDQVSIVRETVQEFGDYDKKAVVMDNDKEPIEMGKADILADKNSIMVHRNYPCIEAVLIKILEPNKDIGGMNSQALKSYFQGKHIPENKRTNMDVYRKKFPKEILDAARERIPELDAMIRIFENR